MKPFITSDDIASLLLTTSFDSAWYWILFAASWSLATYWTLGVGHQEANRARGDDTEEQRDFEESIAIYLRANLPFLDKVGASILGITCFILALIGGYGFLAGSPFLQAFFLLSFPLFLVAVISVRAAYKLRDQPLRGIELLRFYYRLRRQKQVVGFIAITFTSLWGAFVLYNKWLVIGA